MILFRGIDLKKYIHIMELPPEFANMSNDDILSYLRLLNSGGTVAWRRVKMLLLGPGEAGKTTLVHRLISGEFIIKTIRFKLLIISLRNNSCVRLSNNHIGDAGAEYLARALPNMSQLSQLE